VWPPDSHPDRTPRRGDGPAPAGAAPAADPPALVARDGAAAGRDDDLAATDDVALLRRVGAGDERALAALYDRWAGTVHALARRIVREDAEADDVVEDTFWQLWRQAARYDPARGSVSAWLLTVARSRALDRRRARARLREDQEDEPGSLGALAADAGASPLDATVASDRRRIVRAALDGLPGEQREALELAYYGGLSQTEIAERTGTPLGTVKTRMRLALRKLRDGLGGLAEAMT
jgi:RNA polymerase sigma-70 factor (ECF subfamily)